MLIRVFLHAEFISAMKTVQNPTIFMKNAKNRKMNNFVNFGNFLRFSLKLLRRISEKVRKYVFQMEKKTNKAKLEIFKFLKISFIARLQPMIKVELIMPYHQILQKYAHQGIFTCRIHICDENMKKFEISTILMKNAKKQKNE